MAAIDSAEELSSLLERWNDISERAGNVKPLLSRMAELVEQETEAWYKMDPDPFDYRHPGRADPSCTLGHLLKALFKNDSLMTKLVNDYLSGGPNQAELQSLSCRLLLDVMPGLETTVVFQDNEELVLRLLGWAENASDPLRAYATGLLMGAMEVQDIAANFKDTNAGLVPTMLKRLRDMQLLTIETSRPNTPAMKSKLDRPFANIGSEDRGRWPSRGGGKEASPIQAKTDVPLNTALPSPVKPQDGTSSPAAFDTPPKFPRLPGKECSNSSWAEMEPYVIGSYRMSPLTPQMHQRLILQYLTPLGEYQELLCHVFEQNAMELIFYYIDLSRNRDVRLAFEAHKYLAALLCHKKFAIEFINLGGVQRLLEVVRPSVAATGVSMCLYYLAYFDVAMERVCVLSPRVLSDLVSYVLWLLECSHESGRCHAIMFLSLAFQYRVLLELFDQQDGLRKLFNVISTMEILNFDESGAVVALSEDELFTSRQAARHVCVTLKKYFEAHLAIKADEVRRAHIRSEGGSPLAESPSCKANKLAPEAIQDNMELLLECLPLRIQWQPVAQLTKLGGTLKLMQLIAVAAEWTAFSSKAETIRNALDVLAICSVTPRTQLMLCESVLLPENNSTQAISILLGLAEGEILVEPDVQKAALNVIINCVCGPMSRLSSGIFVGSAKKKLLLRNGEDLLVKMWNSVRTNNGIMMPDGVFYYGKSGIIFVLLKLLMTKTPITEADAVRALVCKAVVGLARCDTVKQIISKLPLFTDGQLQQLMKEPVLQDKRLQHVKFCRCASELIERVLGKPQNASIEASLERIRKADVVAQTKIIYQEKELLQLIHDHLLAKGLQETAGYLRREAELPGCNQLSPCVTLHTGVTASSPSLLASPKAIHHHAVTNAATPHSSHHGNHGAGNKSSCSTPACAGPVKLNIINCKTPQPTNHARTCLHPSQRVIQAKNDCVASYYHQSPLSSTSTLAKKVTGVTTCHDASVSLDEIVTEYLRKQHASCMNPVVTCPPFSLLTPHRCPDPQHKSAAPCNFTTRLLRRSCYPRHGGPSGLKLNRKFIYSRFRPVRTYSDSEEDRWFSCCAFSPCDPRLFLCTNRGEFKVYNVATAQPSGRHLLLGTYPGELKLFNVETSEETEAYACHTSPLTQCQPSNDGQLVLTSSSWGRPLSALWGIGNSFELKQGFNDDQYVEFSKQVQDKVVGTKESTAYVYDVSTGRQLLTLYDAHRANNYSHNKATFNPTDDFILSDGVLWDAHSGRSIHKFDKFNPNISGVFHPNSLEIIINSEVWDLRTFRLLHTVPALDHCHIRFNNAGTVIYGAMYHMDDEAQSDDGKIKSPYGSAFRTFDSKDYSNIATIDVKRNIFDLATDSTDCYLAVIENMTSPVTLADDSVCRLYEVGLLKDEDDDQAEEEEEEEAVDDEDDDDDDGSDTIEVIDEPDLDEEDAHSENTDDSSFEVATSDNDDDDDDDDDDLDNLYFELSDMSNF